MILFKFFSSFFIAFLLLIVGLANITKRFFYKKHTKKVFSFKSTLRYFNEDNKSNGNKALEMFMIFYLSIFLISIFALVNNKYSNYLAKIKEGVVGVQGICVAFVAIVVSVIIFTVTLGSKKYYLVFSTKDVLKKYHIGKVFKFLWISCVVSIICSVLLTLWSFLDGELGIILGVYEWAVIILLLTSSYSLYVVGKISFNENQFELKMLNNLYQTFWENRKVYIDGNVNEVSLNYNLRYLLDQYEKVVFNHNPFFNISRIDSIKYISIDNELKWQKKSAKYLSVLGFFFLIISNLFCIFYREIDIKAISINTLIYLAFIYIINLNKILSSIGNDLIKLVLDRKGYYFSINNKDKFVGEVCFYRNIFCEKFIHSIKNIMALYNIILSSENGKEVIESSCLNVIDFLKESEDENFSKYHRALYYLPVIASGYYFYINKISSRTIPKCIKELFMEINLSERDKKKFHTVLNAIIVSACIYQPSEKDKEELRNGGSIRQDYYDGYIDHNNYWRELL